MGSYDRLKIQGKKTIKKKKKKKSLAPNSEIVGIMYVYIAGLTIKGKIRML